MRRGDLAVIGLVSAAAAAGACAHDAAQPPSDPYVASGVAAMNAWFDRLPGCAPTAALKPAVYSPDVTLIEVHGALALTTTPECAQNRCLGECCATCAANWVVTPDWIQGPKRELAIQKTGQSRPMSASVKECKLGEVREHIRKPQVVVSGWLENDPAQPKIIRASICVVKPPPGAPAASLAAEAK